MLNPPRFVQWLLPCQTSTLKTEIKLVLVSGMSGWMMFKCPMMSLPVDIVDHRALSWYSGTDQTNKNQKQHLMCLNDLPEVGLAFWSSL